MIFAADLDNTLIYSRQKSSQLSCPVCVEWRGNEELSYMSRDNLDKLRRLCRRLPVVPVTTRSLEQYGRIRLFQEQPPAFALVCNGGILLENGQIDRQWLAQTRQQIAPCAPWMEQARDYLENCPHRVSALRSVDGLFWFTKLEDNGRAAEELRRQLDREQVSVVENLNKLYVLPRCLTKGLGVRRLRQRLWEQGKNCRIVAAGDSSFDLSMLDEADFALSVDDPEMRGALSQEKTRFWAPKQGQNRADYTDFVLDMVWGEYTI